MGYSIVALKEKIFEMHPEIEKLGASISLSFDGSKKAYLIRISKDGHEFSTYMEKKDADECMDGIKCVHLEIKIDEFLKNVEISGKEFSPNGHKSVVR